MVSIELALQILTLLPPLHFGTPETQTPAVVEGSGVLLISACNPDDHIVVLPGSFAGVAGKDGTVRIIVPAQRPDADSYRVLNSAGEKKINGTIKAGELLSGTCL